jgi:hypothetical protein
MKFESVKVEDAGDKWVPMLDSLDNKHVLSGFIFFPVIAGYLAFIFEPLPEIPTS